MTVNRDQDIRQALHSTELQPYILDPNSLVLNEFSITEEDVRIDIAVVNGSFHGFEIKSDSDTLDRLPKQSQSYSKVFDYLWIACGHRYFEKVKGSIPEYWGILLAETSDRETKISKIREATFNPNICSAAVAGLLWRGEALHLLSKLGLDKGFRSKPRKEICNRLAELVPYSELAPSVRSAIKKRSNWRVGSQQTRYVDSLRSGPKSRNFRKKNLELFLSRVSADLHN